MKILILAALFVSQLLLADEPITTDLPLTESKTASAELRQLDALINATQTSLEQQRALRDLIARYQEMQQLYLQQTGNKELLLQMAKTAQRIQECIERYHLTQSFDPEFLSEISLFAQVAAKRGIPKP